MAGIQQQQDILKILDSIDPSALEYQEWCNVGMALKDAGYGCADWDSWSQRDFSRYNRGECEKKWNTFRGSSKPVGTGTIVQLAKDQGWTPEHASYELDWDSTIGPKDELVVIDKAWIEGREVNEPLDWDPVGQLVKYLETIFEASESVGYVTESWEKDGKYLPTKGLCDRTAGELIQALNQCKGDIGSVMGDCKPEAGAWIRFNPLDGKGVKNENVVEFRHALVESDSMDIDQQNAILRELELPIACLVHSGKKSLHAIVKIEAKDYEEYRKRVDYLYTVLKKNGMNVDTQNKNPSRLSRMPGIMRDGRKQFLLDTNIGKESYNEWQEWIEGVNDDLPDPENLSDVWDNLPDLSPALIEGILRQGDKMLLAGPSKAGKSFSLIELCIAIAEGKKWLNWNCTKGKVMYVNLELNKASCLHRFKDIYTALGLKPENIINIDIWNLRGKAVPLDKLAPKLIRRASKKGFIAIVIDPIYKVITGDENSADQMAAFCNQFDRICTELGCAVIYCHHHSKGTQGSKKSMDRASGSGVFARDPDALLDLIELELTDKLIKQEENKAVCKVCETALERHVQGWEDKISQDDQCSEKAMLDACRLHLKADIYRDMLPRIAEVRKAIQLRTAWRIEGTLREYPKFPPCNLWFDYPVHHVDMVGSLKDVDSEGEKAPWQKAIAKRKPPEKKAEARKESIDTAVEACGIDGDVTVIALEEYLGISKNSVKNRIKEHGGYEIKNGIVIKSGCQIT